MAETGKLGIADSQLGNVLLAFAGADAPLPSSGNMSGKLGMPDALGSVILALSGPEGPKVINLWAASTLMLTQSADSGAELVGHASPQWTLGGQDSQLGDTEPAFSGDDDPLPDIGTRSGRLGLELGGVILGLAGVDTGKVINLFAASTLALVQSADSGAELIGHASPHWVLGGQDSYLGNVELAFVGQSDPRPMTEDRTAKLGTSASALGNMRLALGEEEGDTTVKTWSVAAGSSLSLRQSAISESVFSRGASSELSLTQETSLTRVVLASADSALELDDAASSESDYWVFEVGAESTLLLGSEATGVAGAWICEVAAESTLNLADEVTVSTRQWLHEATAENTLGLDCQATGALGTVVDLVAESSLSLSNEATVMVAAWYDADATSALSLSQAATVELASWAYSVSAGNTLALDQAASETAVRSRLAASTLSMSVSADGVIGHYYDVEAESWIFLWDECDTLKSIGLSATSPLSLTQAVDVRRPWLLSAETVLQETHQEFVPGTLDIIEVTTGLSNSVSVATVLNVGARSPLGMSQRAAFSLIPPGGIIVSAGNTLDLDQDAWITQLGIASSHLAMSQAAAVQRGKPLGSEIDLQQSAGVTVVRNRPAESELDLGQTVTYVLVKHGAVELFDYAPTGSGAVPGTLQGPTPGVTSPFALIYPATGSPIDTIELRPPNLGNKDRLSFDRINRETRGGTLTVFADPDWPKAQTLVLSFSALYREEAHELIRFIRDHLGLEIKLSDWEQRQWKGVITTPSEPVIQDGKNRFSANFEFEGELLSA